MGNVVLVKIFNEVPIQLIWLTFRLQNLRLKIEFSCFSTPRHFSISQMFTMFIIFLPLLWNSKSKITLAQMKQTLLEWTFLLWSSKAFGSARTSWQIPQVWATCIAWLVKTWRSWSNAVFSTNPHLRHLWGLYLSDFSDFLER